MKTITHRELRNNSSRVLAEVRAGAIIAVTNHNELAAVLVPPSLNSYERLVAAGKVRVAHGDTVDLRAIERLPPTPSTPSTPSTLSPPSIPSPRSTGEILREVRGER